MPSIKNKTLNTENNLINDCKLRLVYALIPFFICYITIVFRLFDLTLIDHDNITTHVSSINKPKRPTILDQNGVILATNLLTSSVYANTNKIINSEKTAREIITILTDLKYEDIYQLLSVKKSFVWIKRHITPRDLMKLESLGLPGINFQADEKRVYPHSNLFAHILGYVDIDGKGLAGLEKYLDSSNYSNQESSIRISVDTRVQNVVRSELLEKIQEYNALGAIGIVLNSQNGQIISMVSLPDFDPNNQKKANANQKFNRASLGVYEMGSIFKLFSIAAALDSGKVTLNDVYNVSAPLIIDKHKIYDYHKSAKPEISVQEIFAKSSNIGIAKIALQVGKETQISYFKKMLLFSPLSLEIPEKSAPILPKIWQDSTTVTSSYGYGIAVTSLHTVQAAAALVNNGIIYEATFLTNKTREGVKIISEKTSHEIKKLLRLAVKRGTGRNAEATGYLVGGKTGSAEKSINGKYQRDSNLSSFLGAFPILAPQYIVFVAIDEPHSGKSQNTGGMIAAPAAKNIINRIAPILNVAPENAN